MIKQELFINFRCLWVSDFDVQRHYKKLKKRFENSKRIEGTRSYHCYNPLNNEQMDAKRTSFSLEKTTVALV